jgi:AraC-like DNA-binding protein
MAKQQRQIKYAATRQKRATSEPFATMRPSAIAVLEHWLRVMKITPISTIQWQCSEDWRQNERRLQDAMWYWIEEGTGHRRIGDDSREFKLAPGDLLMMPPATLSVVWSDKGVRFKLVTVHFFAQVYGTVDLLSLLHLTGVFPAAKDAPYESASKTLVQEYTLRIPGWELGVEAAIKQVLLYIIRHHGRVNLPDSQRHEGLLKLQPVFEQIERRLADPELKVADLAEAIYVSEVYLRKLFRGALHMGPVEFVRRRRVDQAATLLRTTNQSIKEIARRCGFRDVPFFYRVFRQLTGTTPLRYRQMEEV